MKRTSIFLPDEMHEALRVRAFMQRTTMGEEIRKAIEQYLDRKASAFRMSREELVLAERSGQTPRKKK